MNKAESRNRAIIYCRVSSEGQADNTSIDSQFEICSKAALAAGLEVVGDYQETSSGGLYTTRVGMQSALTDIESGRADALICYDFSRYSRDRIHQLDIKKRLDDVGARLVFAEGGEFPNTPEGDFMFGISGCVSSLEKDNIRRRTMNGRRETARKGQMPTRVWAPFGYHIPTKADILTGKYPPEQLGKYVIDEIAAPIVRELFTRYAGGESQRSVLHWLQSSGVPTPRGGVRWHTGTITRILGNHVYYGKAEFGKTRTIQDESRIKRGLKLTHYSVPTDEEVRITIDAPPIISKETWDMCQRRKEINRQIFSARPERRSMLTSLMRCPSCSRRMSTYRTRTYHYYGCIKMNPSASSDGTFCNKKRHPTRRVEQLVINAVKTVAGQPDAIDSAYEAYRHSLGSQYSAEELKRLQGEMSELEKAERKTAKAHIEAVDARADSAVYLSILRELAQKKNGLSKRIESCRSGLSQDTKQPKSDVIAAMFRNLDLCFLEGSTATSEEKHKIVSKVIEQIYPSEDGYDVTFRPFIMGGPMILARASFDGDVILEMISSQAPAS